jgi:hypothetical protein
MNLCAIKRVLRTVTAFALVCSTAHSSQTLAIEVKIAIARQTVSEESSDGKVKIEVELVTIVKHPESIALRSVTVPSGIRWLGERGKIDNSDCRANAVVGSNCRQTHFLVFESPKRCLPTAGYMLNWDVGCSADKGCPAAPSKRETTVRLQVPPGC